MKTYAVFFVLALSAVRLSAQECTHLWKSWLDTDPLKPKVLSGDSNAGYAVLAYWGDPTLRLEVKGKLPAVRFTSFESYETKLQLSVDSLFDRDMETDSEGNYTVNVTTKKYNQGRENQLNVAASKVTQVIFYRMYSPQSGVTLDSGDLPRIFAFDARTGAERKCPKASSIPVKWHFPEFLADLVSTVTDFSFRKSAVFIGSNAAVPGYLWAITKLKRGAEVAVVRFKTPTFDATDANVRYWSLCLQDFPKNETLSCLPDWIAKPDADGFATLVVGKGSDVEAAALKAGYNFLPDTRRSGQHVLGFAYRNILPSDDFAAGPLYTGDFKPIGEVMTREEFLK